MNDNGNPGRVWWCAEVATLGLSAYLALSVMLFFVTFSETNQFIAQTGGQCRREYASISAYSAYSVVEALLVSLSIYVVRKLNSFGRSRIALAVGVGTITSLALLTYLGDCG